MTPTEPGATRGYSRFVTLMKILLPGLAAAIFGTMLAWPQIAARTESFMVGFAQLDPRETDPRTLVNPRFHGLDDKEQPYTLIAASAVEGADNPDRVDLMRPQGDILLREGRWIALNGRTGVYSKLERTLDLSGDVILYRDDGFEFQTDQAHVDLLTSAAHGDQPVSGQGPDGTIRSEGFELVDGGAVVHFTGRARMVLRADGGGIAP
ncbi:LPS export ABC transporter periplasmic protein LptC [Roseospira visakhapatnamensis]|uniref:Lipopolysaccharide export system protein LptC n=1 Tax=Roseospira visakhapatnamensis TaxID=390880 RepID=A0A7W6RGD0_9PROT|nr:lipopolysaccharide export system protein LptC [Roseospira visakhapatnamensis]